MMTVPDFHTLPDACEFYFVRHGESESNADGRIQGHHDSSLSNIGLDHAEAAGTWFSGKKIDAILTSPLSRARQTAGAIARHAGTGEPEPLPELMELDTGILSGTRLADLPATDEALYQRFRVHSWEAIPEAERIESLQTRARIVWARLLELAHEGHRRVVCVSHGGMIQWLIKATIGSDDQKWMPLFKVSNCGIFLFRAESTLPEKPVAAGSGGVARSDVTDAPPIPGTGYYGNWVHMNLVPYESA